MKMDRDRRELGKRGIMALRRERDGLNKSIIDWRARIEKIDEDIRSITDEIIQDGDDLYE